MWGDVKGKQGMREGKGKMKAGKRGRRRRAGGGVGGRGDVGRRKGRRRNEGGER